MGGAKGVSAPPPPPPPSRPSFLVAIFMACRNLPNPDLLEFELNKGISTRQIDDVCLGGTTSGSGVLLSLLKR